MAERPMEHFTVDGVNIFEVTDAKARQDISNLKDDFHEYHSELGAGYADQLVSGIQNEDSVPYNFRKVPYDATLEKVEGIVGVDVVVNQLIKSLDSSNWSSEAGVTATFGNGVVTISSTVNGNGIQHRTPIAVQAHKYFATMSVYGASGQTVAISGIPATSSIAIDHTISRANTWETASKIVSSGLTGNMSLYALARGGTYENVKMKDIMLFDLTQMFGTTIADYVYSLETATAGSGVAWLKEHFPKIFDSGYIAHNPGEMVCVSGLSAKKTVGFNQWDEVAEAGTYSNTGAPVLSSSNIRSKNYIKIISGQAYYFKSPKTLYVTKYDSNYVCLGETGVINGVRTFDANVKYIRFCTGDTYGTTYNHDICINLSDTAKNGTYEPYEAHEYPLDSTIDLHGILKLDSNNQLYADGDVYKPDGTVQRRYGIVDLGTLTWSHTSAGYFYTTSINTILKKGSAAGGYSHIICDLFVAQNVASLNSLTDKSMSVDSGGNIQIHDSAYPDNNAFKTAMSGVYLVYEKATTSTETATPYNPVEIVDDFGTEEFITTSLVPVGHETRYAPNLRAKLEMSPDSPDGDGLYIVQQSSGENTYIPLASSATIQNILARLTALEGNTNEG